MRSPLRFAWPVPNAALDKAEPQLLTNPANDERFRAAAVAAIYPHITPARLEAILRPRYPRIAVHARELAHERVVVWYVYRDGRWFPRDEPEASTDEQSEPRRGGSQGNL